jgi:hypothetical protein
VVVQRQFTTDWHRFQTGFQPEILGAYTQGLQFVETLLPRIDPLIRSAAGAFTQLETDAEAALKSPFWREFFVFLGHEAGPSILTLGHALGNVLRGAAGIAVAFGPTLHDFEGWLVRVTGRFARWGQNLSGSNGFTRFVGYVRAEGPVVAHTLGDIAHAGLQLGVALSHYGPGVLHVIDGIVTFAGQHPKIAALALAIFAVRQQVGGLSNRAGGLLGKLTGLAGGAIEVRLALLLWGAAMAGTIALLVHAYQRSAALRDIVGQVRYAFRLLAPYLEGAVHAALLVVDGLIRQVTGAIDIASRTVLGFEHAAEHLPFVGGVIHQFAAGAVGDFNATGQAAADAAASIAALSDYVDGSAGKHAALRRNQGPNSPSRVVVHHAAGGYAPVTLPGTDLGVGTSAPVPAMPSSHRHRRPVDKHAQHLLDRLDAEYTAGRSHLSKERGQLAEAKAHHDTAGMGRLAAAFEKYANHMDQVAKAMHRQAEQVLHDKHASQAQRNAARADERKAAELAAAAHRNAAAAATAYEKALNSERQHHAVEAAKRDECAGVAVLSYAAIRAQEGATRAATQHGGGSVTVPLKVELDGRTIWQTIRPLALRDSGRSAPSGRGV